MQAGFLLKIPTSGFPENANEKSKSTDLDPPTVSDDNEGWMIGIDRDEISATFAVTTVANRSPGTFSAKVFPNSFINRYLWPHCNVLPLKSRSSNSKSN